MSTHTVAIDVEPALRDVERRVRRAIMDLIPDAEPHRWLYRLVRAYPSRPGKALRPALFLATCRAFGGSDAECFPVAVAIEMGLVARFLERLGDHAVNVARRLTYLAPAS